MNFHEYQAKELFAEVGIPVPAGKIARTADEAVEAAKALGGDFWVVKAQIHAGGRGKAGGVKMCRSLEAVREAAAGMLGTRMATYQSGGRALPVDVVLVTEAVVAAEVPAAAVARTRKRSGQFSSPNLLLRPLVCKPQRLFN